MSFDANLTAKRETTALSTAELAHDEVVISVKQLSKCYHIYSQPHDRLKESIYPRVQRLLGKPARQYFREFWALKNVSFEVRRGETVAIIGRNGSGKSTLLQLICGTLDSTGGSVTTKGRVAALLELGAGFNPEFTGRENVYMSGAILGLRKEEIDQRFEAIAAFAEIGDFIEQPVKVYSSGMFVRLAFAVIAHVDADILIIDEALAVGDAVFTQKCMRYIRDFQKRGTLLFVSHDMGSVQNLCQNGIWLAHGEAMMVGSSQEVSEAYLQHTLQETYGKDAKLSAVARKQVAPVVKETKRALDYAAQVVVQDNLEHAKGWQTGVMELLSVTLDRLDCANEGAFLGGERVCLTVRAKAHQDLPQPILGFTVRDRLGQELFGENTLPFTDLQASPVAAGQEFFAEFTFVLPMLPNGEYAVMASAATGTLYDNIQHHFLHDILVLTVSSSKIRWGLVGLPFEHVVLKVVNEQ